MTPPPSTHLPVLLCSALPWTLLWRLGLGLATEMDQGSCRTLRSLGTFPAQHPRRPALAGEDWWGLTLGLKAASPGILFIEYLLLGCHHQRGEG